jgi:hypothetical protein
MSRLAQSALPVAAVVLVVASGCGGSAASISGEVTYEGQPVAKGVITFFPADGKGPAEGGTIVNGRYRVEPITPGPKIVQIERAADGTSFPRSRAGRATAAAGVGADNPAKNRVLAQAADQDLTVAVEPGSQTRNFHLPKPN